MATTASAVCISEPISWLRLEQFAQSRRDAAVSDHIAACPACRACLDEIERDVVALPPLALPEAAKSRRRWWTFAVPAGLALAAAAILLLVLRPRGNDATVPDRLDRTQIKGVGTLELGLVRKRGDITRDDVRTFSDGDAWKVVVTCAAESVPAETWIDVFVYEVGKQSYDYPMQPTPLVCGNGVPLPGAFSIVGNEPNVVCVRAFTGHMPPRIGGQPGDPNVACVTLTPESVPDGR